VVCFSFNPFTNIGRAIFELSSVGFATRQKLYGVATQQRYVVQIQSHMVTCVFQIEQSLQFRDVFGLDSAAKRKDDFSICRSLYFQHDDSPSLYLRLRDCNSDTNIKPLKNEELRESVRASFANSRFFREQKTGFSG